MFPNFANIEFACVTKNGIIRMRVWERGAGITPACGSGACATSIASSLLGILYPCILTANKSFSLSLNILPSTT